MPNEYRNAIARKLINTKPMNVSPRFTSGMKRFVISSSRFRWKMLVSSQPISMIRRIGINVSNQTATKSGIPESSLNRCSFAKELMTKPTKIPLTIATIMPPEPSALKLTLKMPSTICGSMIMMKRASPAKPACLRVWRRCFFSIMEYGIKKARKSEIRLNEKFAKPLQDGKLGKASLMVSRMVPMVPMKIIGIVVRIASCTAATYGFLAARFIFGAKTSDIHCMNFFIGSPPFQIQFSFSLNFWITKSMIAPPSSAPYAF